MLARRVRVAALGAMLAAAVGLSPVAVQPALAAGPLGVRAATTYTVDPDAARIHVAIAYTVTNNKPNTTTTIYYYRSLTLGIQPDARNVRAGDRAGGLGVSTTAHQNFTQLTVRLRANLYYHRSASFTLRYDLLGGKPRSSTPSRVGKAFVTFGVWAFGDRDAGTVEVRMPAGFTTTIDGGPMTTKTSSGGNVAKAAPAVPDEFFAVVTGEDSAAYEYERLALGGGVNLAVLAWPEDDRWSASVTATLREGMPDLVDRIGLDWPVAKDLKVTERYTPSLEGYAGLFFVEDERIDVSEDLDQATILHEASHAWLNEHLFAQRWIYEGLAEEYSWQVLTAIGGKPPAIPAKPKAGDKAAVTLNAWTFPDVIRDDTDDTELYGYHASFWLVHLIAEAAGEDRMRDAFARAQRNLTAYPGGEGAPEQVGAVDDWRRFLDLTEPLDEPDPTAVIEAVGQYALTGADRATLAERTAARDAYRELLADPDGWVPSWYVRSALSGWQFDAATTRIADAAAVLARRDEVEAAAAAEGLGLDGELEALYEGARDGFDDATALAGAELEALDAIATAHASVDSAPDLFAQIGLLGETPPDAAYQAARSAFEAGDLDAAVGQAGVATSIVTRAPTMGQERVIMATIVVVAVAGFLVFFVVVRRRRARAEARLAIVPGSPALRALDARFAPDAAAAGSNPAPSLDPAPDAAEASGTLGGHSGVPPSLLGDGDSDGEGGSVTG